MYRLLVTGIGSTATNDRQQIQLSHQAQNCLEVHALSGLALALYNSRTDGITPRNQIEVFLDEHFDNARMERVYPNAKKT